jgi:uncharacterized membrane protein YjfL (UPF0719 family)
LDAFDAFIFIASLVIAVERWFDWYRDLSRVNRFAVTLRSRALLFAIPVCCAVIFLLTLRSLGDDAVRHSAFYLALYVSLGMAWLAVMILVFAFLGISARDDALERGNPSASWAIAGALLGAAFCFDGANIGNGPGVGAVVFSALLSTGFFVLLWFSVERFASFAEEVTVERNLGAGIRLGGFLAALGLICGWMVAGDWVSEIATLRDFARDCWPAILLSAGAIVVERVRKRDVSAPGNAGASIGFAIAYLVCASAWVIARGVR